MVNAKKNIKMILKMAVFFMVFMMFINSAQAFTIGGLFSSENNIDKLKSIDKKIGSLSENTRLMKFINFNMFDQDVDAISIYITENDNILRKYYIVRSNERSGVALIKQDIPEQNGIWKFYPDVDQSIKGLELAEKGFDLYNDRHSLETKTRIPYFVLRSMFLYRGVDTENVPSVSEMIERSNCNKCKKALKLIYY